MGSHHFFELTAVISSLLFIRKLDVNLVCSDVMFSVSGTTWIITIPKCIETECSLTPSCFLLAHRPCTYDGRTRYASFLLIFHVFIFSCENCMLWQFWRHLASSHPRLFKHQAQNSTLTLRFGIDFPSKK